MLKHADLEKGRTEKRWDTPSPVDISELRASVWEGQALATEGFPQEAAKCFWVRPRRNWKGPATAGPHTGQTVPAVQSTHRTVSDITSHLTRASQ